MTLPETNLLIKGDNRAVLDALRSTHRGKIQLVYIDPPYNTGLAVRGDQQTKGYRDRQSSPEWLQDMSSRFASIRELLTDSGSLMVQLDDNEVDAAKLALDRIFGREHFINRIIVQVRAPSSFSTVNTGLFKTTEYILWYAKDRKQLKTHPVRTARAPDPAYRLWLENPDDAPENWRVIPLSQAHPQADLDSVRIKHAHRVCRLAPISDTKAGKKTVAAKAISLAQPKRVFVVERERHGAQYLLRGSQLVFYDKQVQEIDGRLQASRPLTNLWTDISWEGIAREGGVVYKTGKKPEHLLRRCLQLCTDPQDWVLDCFLGSGTTAASAHKMQRQWIGIESGEAIQLSRDRLNRVCSGEDQRGISRLCNWEGGGDFAFLKWDDGLSLLE